MKKSLFSKILIFSFLVLLTAKSEAAYVSRFDAMVYHPTVDGGPYFSVYGTKTHEAWQGHLGFTFDYANRPLQFSGFGFLLGQRQSVIDHMLTLHTVGSIGFTDWFTAGLRVPIVLYNWFYSDEPIAAPSGTPDKAAMMGDLEVVMKFRIVDLEKHRVGVAFIPRLTLPSGDPIRYTGSGNLTGGGTLAVEFEPVRDVLNIGVNAGAIMRDEATRFGVTIGPQLTYGLGVNYHFHRRWAVIAEGFGSTTFANLFAEVNSPLEAGAGIRHIFGDSGFSLDAAGNAGIIDGAASPRFRGMLTLGWASPAKEPRPIPEPRIEGNKIVLLGAIFFDTNKATIKAISYPVLDDVVDVLQKHPEITLVEVQGHTDNRASDSYNLKLSQARSESTVDYLVQKGIDRSRLQPKGYGESQPIATNDTAEGMSQNRRTEFVILSTTDPAIIQHRDETTRPPVETQTQTTAPPPVTTSTDSSSPTTPDNTENWPNFSE